MKQLYYYQSEGEKPMMSIGWWFVIITGALLITWKFLPLSKLWSNFFPY